MFIGHFALGFAAKKASPKTSLATLFAAAQLADILWPIFLALGVEQVVIAPGITKLTPLDFVSYPVSHSLLMLVIWGALFGGLYYARTKNSRGAMIIAALVVSHWFLDWITHRPDMPLYPGGPKVGLGLWNSVRWSMGVELVLYAVGVAIYDSATRPLSRAAQVGFWVLVILLLVAFIVSSFAAPPSSVKGLWTTAMIATLVTLVLAWWVDRNHEPA